MEAEYLKSLLATIDVLYKEGLSYMFLNQYSSMVSSAREATAMGSTYLDPFNKQPVRGEVTYDKMFWIDSDIGWDVADFMKLYNSDKDIISGLYINEKRVPMFSVDKENAGAEIERILKSSEPEEIFAAGFGFICMKQGVFENIKRPWFEIVFQELKNEDGTESILIPYGEDFSWCKKAKDSGFKIYLDSTVHVSHYKKVNARLDIGPNEPSAF